MDGAGLRILDFFTGNLPSARLVVIGGIPGLLWAYACLRFAGYLKQVKGWRTGYTRKTFHFLTFVTVTAIQSLWGVRAVCLFGASASAVVLYAVARGRGHVLFEAMAREQDEPHRTRYVLMPYFATLLGGLAANIFFGPGALVGYLVAGLGDAVGEPIGVRFGRHRYRVPSFHGVSCQRSLEGSSAVFVISLLAVALGVMLSPGLAFSLRGLPWVLLLALVSALVEAVSPHGWDNTSMQVVPALLAVMVFQ